MHVLQHQSHFGTLLGSMARDVIKQIEGRQKGDISGDQQASTSVKYVSPSQGPPLSQAATCLPPPVPCRAPRPVLPPVLPPVPPAMQQQLQL
eukprot:scaffold650167_cov50-Prasinocladus_malaysianus.AAC.1